MGTDGKLKATVISNQRDGMACILIPEMQADLPLV